MSCRRLLTLLSLRVGQLNRTHAAGMLWPGVTAARANANLRSALWRLQRTCREVVDCTFSDIRLAQHVKVDIHQVQETARSLLDRSRARDCDELMEALQCNFHDDILPEFCDEEWLTAEAERHRQLRLHTLETLAEQLIAGGGYGGAIEAALGACHADPFRESSRELLIRACLAEGNQLEARRRHANYCALLRDELGLEPSDQFMQLLGRLTRPENRLSSPR